MNISVVIPVKNEQENVKILTNEIEEALTPTKILFEIIYVDDGSTDETYKELTKLSVTTIRHKFSYGQSQAIHTGINMAKYDYIVTLDGDGQNNPADIPKLIDVYKDNKFFGFVMGERQKRQDNLLRKISSRVANKVRGRMLKDDSNDSGCGLKMAPKKIWLMLPYFDHMHRFMPTLAKREGLEIEFVPV
ncbi:MAG: glycosyltransferase, partial [Desulfobacteraceae bacterium]|nr:glycosyltransferase [Desulfobacteraceae bacterium]